MWQELIVGLCVLAATAYVLRQWLPKRGKSATCGSCNGCSATPNAQQPTHNTKQCRNPGSPS